MKWHFEEAAHALEFGVLKSDQELWYVAVG